MELTRVGDIVRTEEHWGASQHVRLRCVCGRYMPKGEKTACTRCGTRYMAIADRFHEVVSRG